MHAAKILQLKINLGKRDLNDLFDLLRPPKVSRRGAGNEPFMPLKNVLKGRIVACQTRASLHA